MLTETREYIGLGGNGQIPGQLWLKLKRLRDQNYPDCTMEWMVEHAIRYCTNFEKPGRRWPGTGPKT